MSSDSEPLSARTRSRQALKKLQCSQPPTSPAISAASPKIEQTSPGELLAAASSGDAKPHASPSAATPGASPLSKDSQPLPAETPADSPADGEKSEDFPELGKNGDPFIPHPSSVHGQEHDLGEPATRFDDLDKILESKWSPASAPSTEVSLAMKIQKMEEDPAFQQSINRDTNQRMEELRQIFGCEAVDPASQMVLQHFFRELRDIVDNVAKHLSNEPVSPKVPELDACERFEAISPNYVEHLADSATRPYIFTAYLWDVLIANVFEPPSLLWAGLVGQQFEQVCERIKVRVDSYKANNERSKFNALARFRESSARFALEICSRILEGDYRYYGVDCFSEDSIEQATEECSRMAKEMMGQLRHFANVHLLEDTLQGALEEMLAYAGGLKQRLMVEKPIYKLLMAGSLGDPGVRHNLHYTSEMIQLGEDMGMLSEGLTKVDFVVYPLLMRYGHCESATDPVRRTIEMPPECIVKPGVLCQEYSKRRRDWAAMPKAAQKTSLFQGNRRKRMKRGYRQV